MRLALNRAHLFVNSANTRTVIEVAVGTSLLSLVQFAALAPAAERNPQMRFGVLGVHGVLHCETSAGAFGWLCRGDTLTSPSAGFWFDRETLEADANKIYAPAARCAYSLTALPRFRKELRELLEVLAEDPGIATLAAQMQALQAAVASWEPGHGLATSVWDFGYAALRATARHPIGGVGRDRMSDGRRTECRNLGVPLGRRRRARNPSLLVNATSIGPLEPR